MSEIATISNNSLDEDIVNIPSSEAKEIFDILTEYIQFYSLIENKTVLDKKIIMCLQRIKECIIKYYESVDIITKNNIDIILIIKYFKKLDFTEFLEYISLIDRHWIEDISSNSFDNPNKLSSPSNIKLNIFNIEYILLCSKLKNRYNEINMIVNHSKIISIMVTQNKINYFLSLYILNFLFSGEEFINCKKIIHDTVFPNDNKWNKFKYLEC